MEKSHQINVRDFFDSLKGADRKDLTHTLEILKKNNLDAAVIGGAVIAVSHSKDYNDIDLIVGGEKENFENLKKEINFTPVKVGDYVGFVEADNRIKYNNIDILYTSLDMFSDPIHYQINLLRKP